MTRIIILWSNGLKAKARREAKEVWQVGEEKGGWMWSRENREFTKAAADRSERSRGRVKENEGTG